MLPSQQKYQAEIALFESTMREQMLFFPGDLQVKSYAAQMGSIAEDVGALVAKQQVVDATIADGEFRFTSKLSAEKIQESIRIPTAKITRSLQAVDGAYSYVVRPKQKAELAEEVSALSGQEARLVSEAISEIAESILPSMKTMLCESAAPALITESAKWNGISPRASAGLKLAESVEFLTEAHSLALDRKDESLVGKIATIRAFALKALEESETKQIAEAGGEISKMHPLGKIVAWWDLSKWAKGATAPRATSKGGMTFLGDDGSTYLCDFQTGKVSRVGSMTPEGKAGRSSKAEVKESKVGQLKEWSDDEWDAMSKWTVHVSFPIEMKAKKSEIEKQIEKLADRRGGRLEMSSVGAMNFGFAIQFEEGDANTSGFIQLVKEAFPKATVEHDEDDVTYGSTEESRSFRESNTGVMDRVNKTQAMMSDIVKMADEPLKKEAQTLLMQIAAFKKKAAGMVKTEAKKKLVKESLSGSAEMTESDLHEVIAYAFDGQLYTWEGLKAKAEKIGKTAKDLLKSGDASRYTVEDALDHEGSVEAENEDGEMEVVHEMDENVESDDSSCVDEDAEMQTEARKTIKDITGEDVYPMGLAALVKSASSGMNGYPERIKNFWDNLEESEFPWSMRMAFEGAIAKLRASKSPAIGKKGMEALALFYSKNEIRNAMQRNFMPEDQIAADLALVPNLK